MIHGSRTVTYRYARRGLTLLEVIVAMTVLAIGIAGVLKAITTCIAAGNHAESYSCAVILAQQVAFELERSSSLDTGHLFGMFDDAEAKGYTWEAKVEQADAQGLQPVQITVLWGPEAHRRKYFLHTSLRPQAGETDTTIPTTPEAGP